MARRQRFPGLGQFFASFLASDCIKRTTNDSESYQWVKTVEADRFFSTDVPASRLGKLDTQVVLVVG